MKALVDCAADLSLIHNRFVQQHHVPTITLDHSIPTVVADDRPILGGDITCSTSPILVSATAHSEVHSSFHSFHVASIGRHNLILGAPWLVQNNPVINWQERTITFPARDQAKSEPPSSLEPMARLSATSTQVASKASPLVSPAPAQPTLSSPALSAAPLSNPAPVIKPVSVSSISCASLRRSIRKAGVTIMGITTVEQVSDLVSAIPNPDGEDDDAPPDHAQLLNLIPPEHHGYLDVFSKVNADRLPKHSPYDHAIDLEEGKQPKFSPIYLCSARELQALDAYLRDMLAKGFIRPSTSSAGSPILFVKKKDGSLRVCVDYRELNAITRKNRYPLPLIHENLARLAGAKYYTKIDLRSAYHLIRIKKGDEWKTAIRSRFGLFEYLVMPFGLTNAPASFQNLINDVLRPFLDKFVIVYLDDILIFSNTEEEHTAHVHQVLERLRKNELWANASKCEFNKTEVDYLGYVVTPDGIKMDTKKVTAILEWPAPTNLGGVRSFLGFANFYRRFIRNYSQIVAALVHLTKKNVPFQWHASEQAAFETLKTAFTTAPVLTHFQLGLPLVIETDASDYGIGAVISHVIEGVLHPIAFLSRKLLPAELNYDIYNKEMLAVIEALRSWRCYVDGCEDLTIRTDHKNLEYWKTARVLNRRHIRWLHLMQEHRPKIVYTPGKSMTKADTLSRRQGFQEGTKPTDSPPTALLSPDQFETVSEPSATIAVTQAERDAAQDAELEATTSLMKRIRDAQPEDPALSELLPYLHDPTLPRPDHLRDDLEVVEYVDGAVHLGHVLYVPDDHQLKLDVIKQCHNDPLAGHFGQKKTRHLASRYFYFPGMRDFIDRYVNGCQTCARNKTPRHKRYGLLQPLPIPVAPWTSISMDAIVKLPTSNGYDCIMIFVCRFSKMAHFVPYTELGFDSPKQAEMFFDSIVRLHGIPTDIVSDRGSLTRSAFWRAFVTLLGSTPNFTTAFHPQANGGNERINQVLEQYLRIYINHNQDNWALHSKLAQAEFVYNNSVHSSTGFTPFEVVYGLHPRSPLDHGQPSKVPAVNEFNQQRASLQAQLVENLTKAQQSYKRFYDRHARDAPHFEVGQHVYLSTKHIKPAQEAAKLSQRQIGPLKIIAPTKSPLAWVLELPAGINVNPLFHVSLLEPVQAGHPGQFQDEPPVIMVDGEQEYQLDFILDSRLDPDDPTNYQYLCKWRDVSDAENSWEPYEYVYNTGAFRIFKRAHKGNPNHVFPQTAPRRRRRQQ